MVRTRGGRPARKSTHMRPLDWPKMEVNLNSDDAQLAAMIARVEATSGHLDELDATDRSQSAARTKDVPAEFFDMGEMPVREFLAALARGKFVKDDLDTCFELGCGVRRSTVCLARHFQNLIVADMSEHAVRETHRNLTLVSRHNVKVVHASRIASLSELPRLDAFFSISVLQYYPPPLQRYILDILLSKLKVGGIGYFRLWTYRRGYCFDTSSYLARPLNPSVPEMHVLPQPALYRLFEERGCRLVEIREDPIVGDDISNRILVRRLSDD